jgi:hypothetical protein
MVTYVAEPWNLLNTMERVLMTWERKIQRKIYGLTNKNGYWGINIKQEMYKRT